MSCRPCATSQMRWRSRWTGEHLHAVYYHPVRESVPIVTCGKLQAL